MWTYKNTEQVDVPAKMIGFVYCITNQVNGRKYIGRKLYHFSKTKQVKLKRKKVKVESDWREYYGSSDELKADVQAMGSENFTRTILHQCPTLGVLGYLEAREQFDRRVLENDDYYNGWTLCRIRKTHLKALYAAV